MASPASGSFVGKRIREYEILAMIGQGRMGAVYRARHMLLEQERAVKIVQTGIAGSSDLADRFIREARILARMRHPNLVELYEFGKLDEITFFMIQELLTGENVRRRVDTLQNIPVLDAVRIVREAALGLHLAHSMGVLHRDVSPDNLFLVKNEAGDEVTKVIDFAIARPTFQEARTMQSTPALLGRPEFWSPEQFGVSGQEVELDQRTDIYSLGVTLYYMLSGKLPFVSLVPKGTPEPFAAGQVPSKLDHMIRKMLSLERDHRQGSMMDLIQDLDQVTYREIPQTMQLTKTSVKAVHFQPGFVFAGRYEIQKKIGKGGMGTVFKALDKILDIPVALKTMNPDIATDEKTLARLKREVILARKVGHPNVCRIYDIGESQGTHYVSMEFVDGMTLSDLLLVRGKLAPEEGLRILRQVLLALQDTHRAGVIHRDLKPQNIMVDVQQKAYIMDFGISFSADVGRLTATGMMIGTPRYMAPEQFSEAPSDLRADIYSMGIIFYEVFTGRLPFDAKTPATVMYAHLNATPTPPTELDPAISLKLERIMLKMLEKDPKNRYQNVGALLAAVDAVLADHPTQDAPHVENLPAPEPVAVASPAPVFVAPPPSPAPAPPQPMPLPVASPAPIHRPATAKDPAPRPAVAQRPAPAPAPPRPQPAAPVYRVEPAAEPRSMVLPLVFVILAVIVGGSAAWYYFIRTPESTPATSAKGLSVPEVPAKKPEPQKPTGNAKGAPNANPVPAQPAPSEPAKEPVPEEPKGSEPPASDPAAPLERKIQVESRPPGASITLNGADTGMQTPAAITVKSGQPSQIELRLQGFEPGRQTIDSTTPDLLALTLTPVPAPSQPAPSQPAPTPAPAGPGTITYQGEYPVSILDGRKVILDTSKGESAQLPAGNYKLTLVSTSKAVIRQNIKVEVKAGQTVIIPAPPMSRFSLNATPSNCKIFIDTTFVDVAPIFDLPLQAGNHHIRASWEKLGKEKSGFFTVEPGKTMTLRAIADETNVEIFEEAAQP